MLQRVTFIARNNLPKLNYVVAWQLTDNQGLEDLRPAGTKTPGHHFCDADFFFGSGGHRGLAHLAANVRHLPNLNAPPNEYPAVPFLGGQLEWRDTGYSRNPTTILGGVIGRLQFQGPNDPELARRLVWGHFTGAGKNGAFGLGLYRLVGWQRLARQDSAGSGGGQVCQPHCRRRVQRVLQSGLL